MRSHGLFAARQRGILLTFARNPDGLFSTHPIFPLDTQSCSCCVPSESFLQCRPALRLVAYGICGPSSQLGSPSDLHLTSLLKVWESHWGVAAHIVCVCVCVAGTVNNRVQLSLHMDLDDTRCLAASFWPRSGFHKWCRPFDMNIGEIYKYW